MQIYINLLSIDQFTYFTRNISSTEKDITYGYHIGKAGIAIEKLSTIWKSDLLDKIK